MKHKAERSASPLAPLRENRAVAFARGAVLALLFMSAVFLLIAGLLQTSVIDPKHYRDEHILFATDDAVKNISVLLMLIAGSVGALALLRRQPGRGLMRAAKAALVIWIFGLSCFWAFSVRSVPATDSARIVDAARLAANDDFSFFHTKLQYFQMFPFQLGLVTFYELFFRIFAERASAVLWLVNAASLAAGELALVVLAEQLFSDHRVALVTAVLLALCPQPILFSSFLYGNLPGFAAILWAFVLVVRFLGGARARSIVWIALLCALAVMLKSNSWIGVAAIVLTLLITLPTRFCPARLVCCAAVIAAPLLLTHAVRTGYEARAQISLGEGTPQTAWLMMGLSESDRAPGWYNGYSYSILKDAGWDADAARQIIAGDLTSRLHELLQERGALGTFLLQKTLSQWNEPSFESIWISEVKQHETSLPAFAESVYDGAAGGVHAGWFEHGTSFCYAAFSIGLFALLPRRSRNDATVGGGVSAQNCAAALLLTLYLLGGFLYHLLFEAKSQYALLYVVAMAPIAAAGLLHLSNLLMRVFGAGGVAPPSARSEKTRK